MLKCLAVLGSPNPNGYGKLLIEKVKKELKERNVELELDILNVSEKEYKLCKGCSQCFINGNCNLTKEDNYDFYNTLMNYKGIIFFVPSYIHQMPAILKNCFDRMASKMHEFPFLGKKIIVVAYSLSNGEQDLKMYVAGVLGSLGSEIVDAIEFNQCRDNEEALKNRIADGVIVMKEKIEGKRFAVTKTQEQLFTYIKQIVNMEKANQVNSHKQIRWNELIGYNSLADYLKHAQI